MPQPVKGHRPVGVRVLGQWPVVCQESLKVLDRLVGQTVVGNEQLMPAGCITQMESEPVQKSGTAPPESGKSVSPPHISLPGFEAALPVVASQLVQLSNEGVVNAFCGHIEKAPYIQNCVQLDALHPLARRAISGASLQN